MAFIERRGSIAGDAEISLELKPSQVDDVLKSLVVLDLGGGQVGAVSYSSSQPSSARLAEIPFHVDTITDGTTTDGENSGEAAGGLAGILDQLQGATVAVSTANRVVTGSVLTVERREVKTDAKEAPILRDELVVASENGEIARLDLADVRSVRLLDDDARHNIKEFTDATATARRRDAKRIVITSAGRGSREMAVNYLVAAPIWKTTYRVVIDGTTKPFFQGWAIVDNVSDEDWKDVSLSLVSGSPVSFIQSLQQPLYRYRPVIPIAEDLNVTPQVHEAPEPASLGGVPGGIVGGVPGGVAGGIGPGSGGIGTAAGRGYGSAAPSAGPVTSLSDAITGQDSGIKAAATGNEVGDLFEYKIDRPVTVPRNRSALIPILQTRMEGERVGIYNESTRKDRPMSGLRLKNTSALTLEDGSLTVIDGDAYAGEALIERLKPGEERFISYAVDLGTLVTARSEPGKNRPVFLVRSINGVFQCHYYQIETKTYTLTNQTDKPRVVYIEHPIRKDWLLADDAAEPAAKPVERTATFYRFRVEIAPRAKFELPVVERRALMDHYQISNLTTGEIELFVSRGYLDQAARQSMEKILDLKARIAATDSEIAAVDKEVSEITSDQARLRENIKALKETSEARQLIARYISKANGQETRVEGLTAQRRTLVEKKAALQREVDDAIRNLKFERAL
ncbi:MAG TPA: hypothetical protein VFV34_23485 [Blastocatellia bacterium]|nr:hypothetical protein [Blastocatellia bacterium]